MKKKLLISLLLLLPVFVWSQQTVTTLAVLDTLITEKLKQLEVTVASADLDSEKQCASLLKLIKDNKGIVTSEQLAKVQEGIFYYYVGQRNIAKARQHYKIAIAQLDAINDNGYSLAKKYRLGFILDTLQGNFKDGIYKFQQSSRLNDSLLQVSKTKSINELQVKYKVAKKDNDLLTQHKNIELLEKQKQFHQAAIKRDSIIKTVTYIFLGLFLVIIFILFRGYAARKKAGLALENKQEEIKIKNGQLEVLVDEKEWLLREVHHRVKNNLQIVMSLLNSQSSFLEDEAALLAIKNSQHRVHSMALIHQKLYKSDEFSTLHMPDYIHELVTYLKDSFDTKGLITFNVNVEDVEMDVTQAVPIGLIINEAVTNCIKYAFPDNKRGSIVVSLLHSHDDVFILSISDDGIGFPESFDISKAQSLGLKLIKGLSRDLEGTFTISGKGGTLVAVEFIYKYKLKYQKSVI